MAHILMTVNVTRHLVLMKQLCTLPPHVKIVYNLSIEQQNLIGTLEAHCKTLLSALIEREAVWFNKFNSKRNRMTRSVESEICTNRAAPAIWVPIFCLSVCLSVCVSVT
jgi:hypothetical protein